MKGQFGLDLQGGPGAIYKVDGATGAVTLFANVTLDGVPNPGPALGNLAYDSAHKQLFVSDLYTGMIHRFALDGSDRGAPYDHGVTGLTAAKLPALAFDPKNRPNIASDRFDSEDPNTWGYAPAARRVWGLAVHDGRLFYSARNGSRTDGPQIWSVGIAADGNFAADPRWELDVPAKPGPYAVSDIAFSQSGAMILAQRAAVAGAYDYVAFTQGGEPRVLRYWLETPDDPKTPSRWIAAPEEYAVGFAGDYRNTNGGVALGYGYDKDGALQSGSCEAALWTTGQNLRNNPALRQPARARRTAGGERAARQPGRSGARCQCAADAQLFHRLRRQVRRRARQRPHGQRADSHQALFGIGHRQTHSGASQCVVHRRSAAARLHADLRMPAGHRAQRQGMREAGHARMGRCTIRPSARAAARRAPCGDGQCIPEIRRIRRTAANRRW